MRIRNFPQLLRALRHGKQRDQCAEQRSADEHKTLRHVGPDDRFHAADERVENHDKARPKNQQGQTPAGQWRKGQREEIQNRSHPRQLCEQIANNGRFWPTRRSGVPNVRKRKLRPSDDKRGQTISPPPRPRRESTG